jgi:hypothetical protein
MAGELDDLGFEEEADLSDLGFEEEPSQPAAAVQPEPLPTSAPRKAIPGWASVLGGASQGISLGFVDEAAGARDAGLSALLNAAAAANTGDLDYLSRIPGDAQRVYGDTRDAARGTLQQAREDNPKSFFAGELGGAVLTAPVTGGGGAARAMGLGALGGIGASEADDVGGIGRDAATGAAFGYAGQQLGEVLGEAAVPVGRWAGQKIGNALSEGSTNLQEGLGGFARERALKAAGYIQKDFPRERGKRLALLERGQTLLDEPGLITPGASAANIGTRLEPLKQRTGEQIGDFLDAADSQAAAADLAFTGGTFNPYQFLSRAREEVVTPAIRDPSLSSQGRTLDRWLQRMRTTDQELAMEGQPFSFRLANEYKGNLQKGIFNNRGDISKNKELANDLQRVLTEEIDTQATPLLGREQVAQFQEARRRYGTFKEALDKATQGENREMGNQFFGLGDRMTAETAASMSLGPVGSAGVGLASKMLRGRADSTAAYLSNQVADSDWLRALVDTDPAAVEAFMAHVGAVGGRAAGEAAVHHWNQAATDPDYQRALQKMGERATE